MNERGERLCRETVNLRHLKAFKVHQRLPWWLRQCRICLQCKRPRFDPWVRKIPWRREQLPTPVFLPGESHGRGAWRATVHGVSGSDTPEQLTLSLSRATKFNSTPFILCLRQFSMKEIKILFSQQSQSWACILRKH